MLPALENVALPGAPKTAGCAVGGGLHESPLSHAGGDTDTGNPPSTRASYTATRLPSCPKSLDAVPKNTLLPFALASRKNDSYPPATSLIGYTCPFSYSY